MLLALHEQDMTFTRLLDVQLQNPVAHARTDHVRIRARFPNGALNNDDELAVVGATDQTEIVQWKAEGVRNSDGSVRYAVCDLRCDLDASEAKQVQLGRGQGVARPFTVVQDVLTGLAASRIELVLPAITHGQDTWPATVVRFDTALLRLVEGGNGNDAIAIFDRWQRVVGTSLWCKLKLRVHSGLKHVPFTVQFGHGITGDATTSPRETHVRPQGRIELRITGPRVAVRYATVRTLAETVQNNVTTIRLMEPTEIRNSQNQLLWIAWDRLAFGNAPILQGVLLFGAIDATARAEIEGDVNATAMNWADVGIPPFNFVPPMPAWFTDRDDAIDSVQRQVVRNMRTGVDGRDPFARNLHGLLPRTGDPGDQGAFCVLYDLAWPAAAIGWPGFLPVMRRDNQSWAQRYFFFYDPDGEPWDAEDRGPTAFFWYGGPFRLSRDRLGLPVNREIGSADVPRNRGGDRFLGPNRQHWEASHELAVHTLSPDLFTDDMVAMYAQSWIAAHWTNTLSPNVNQLESPRAFGRAVTVGLWIHELTDDEGVLAVIRQRNALAKRDWLGVHLPDRVDRMNPFLHQGRDDRVLVRHESFFFFQNAFAVKALIGCAERLNDSATMDIAYRVARSIVNFGYVDLRTDEQNVIVWLAENEPRRPTRGDTIRDLGSSAEGEIWWAERLGTNGPDRVWRLYLRNCTGQFQPGNQASNVTAGWQTQLRFRNWGIWPIKVLALGNPDRSMPPTPTQRYAIYWDATRNSERAEYVEYAFGTDFDKWQIAVVAWAHQEALRRNDTVTAAAAIPILQNYRARQAPDRDRFWGDLMAWTALVADPFAGVP